MKKYKLAIIGYGGMGSWHAENITKRIGCIEISGAYDIKPERRVAAKSDGYTAFETADALFASKPDIVLVATPNNFHKSYSIEAMERGCAVVCEKPVCMNSRELEEILAVSERTGRLFTVHHNSKGAISLYCFSVSFIPKLLG